MSSALVSSVSVSASGKLMVVVRVITFSDSTGCSGCSMSAHLQSSVFKLSKDLIDSIHEEGIVAYTS